jgi:hypothetical protein
VYWFILFIIIVIFYFLDFLPEFVKKRIFKNDMFFWRLDAYLQMIKLRRLNTIQGRAITNIFFLIGEKSKYVNLIEYYFYGRNYLIIDMIDSELTLDNINFLLNEIKYKPSIIFLHLLLKFDFISKLKVLTWLKFYFNILDERLKYEYFKELRNLKLYFKLLWDYEYYFFGKAEARMGIWGGWIDVAVPITPFFCLEEGSEKEAPYIRFKKEIFYVKKNDKNVREIKFKYNNDTYLVHHLVMDDVFAYKYVIKKLNDDFNTAYNDGILYLSATEEKQRIYDNERKQLNSIFWDNTIFFGEMIEELREEWYKELKNNKRDFYKINN